MNAQILLACFLYFFSFICMVLFICCSPSFTPCPFAHHHEFSCLIGCCRSLRPRKMWLSRIYLIEGNKKYDMWAWWWMDVCMAIRVDRAVHTHIHTHKHRVWHYAQSYWPVTGVLLRSVLRLWLLGAKPRPATQIKAAGRVPSLYTDRKALPSDGDSPFKHRPYYRL